MTGISIQVELRDPELRDQLADMIARMSNRRAFHERIGDRMLLSVSNNFRNQSGPDGTAWTPLRPKTIKARERKKLTPIRILRARGYLAGSINSSATEDEVRIGSASKEAAIHQLGGTIQRPARSGKIYRTKDRTGQIGRRFARKEKANHITGVKIPSYSITMPARPFLGFSRADEAMLLDEALDWLTR